MLKEANPVAFLAYFDALYGNLVSRLDMIRLIYGPSNSTQGKIVLHVECRMTYTNSPISSFTNLICYFAKCVFIF